MSIVDEFFSNIPGLNFNKCMISMRDYLLDEVFVIREIINVEVRVIRRAESEAGNSLLPRYAARRR